MEMAWQRPFLLVLSLFLLTATLSSAESFATANSRLFDESLEERLILFPTKELNEKHSEYGVYPGDNIWRSLKMSTKSKGKGGKGKGKGKGTGKSKHKKRHHHHPKRKATYNYSTKGGKYKGNKGLPSRYVSNENRVLLFATTIHIFIERYGSKSVLLTRIFLHCIFTAVECLYML